MNIAYVEVRRTSPRFQLIKREIEKLSPSGTYHFVAADGGREIQYKATRQQLEEVFARAMKTMSYRERGLFHQYPWPLAAQFRIHME